MRWMCRGALCILALLLCLSACDAARSLQQQQFKCKSPLTDLKCDPDCLKRRARIHELGLLPVENAVECFTLFADGTQVYECPNGDGVWALVDETSTLFPTKTKKDKTRASRSTTTRAEFQGGQRRWVAPDGSELTTVAATRPVVYRAPSLDDRRRNIPWLSTKRAGGLKGPQFGNVVAVVRVDTVGGIPPPSSDCDVKGKQVSVPYSAAYVFYESTA